jgi:hypothetical protein
MRETYVLRGGKLVPKQFEPIVTKSSLPCPFLVLDSIPEFKSMADGRLYDSKARYYRTLKEHGCRIVETGEDHGQPAPKVDAKREVEAAYCKVRDGYKPAPLTPESEI